MRARSLVVGLVVAPLVLIWTVVPLSHSEPRVLQCMNEATRDKVRMISLEAVDQALKNQVTRLWEVWMKDPRGQPQRAQEGMRNAINAYSRSRTDALGWLPPICSDNPRG